MILKRVLLLTAAAAMAAISTTPIPAPFSELESATPAKARVAEPQQSEPSKEPCCFQNPRYPGTCKVQPAEDETCASILAYLNNPMAQGKTYCGGTDVRQGWTEVPCEEESGTSCVAALGDRERQT
ncbi:MAG TPA: hypothetical protein VEK15_25075 [Vicinamibacteria bacterium]|nr:hypothetical protein [Vicinamibacteria bacterium]